MGSKSTHSRHRYVFWLGEWALAFPFHIICAMGEIIRTRRSKGRGNSYFPYPDLLGVFFFFFFFFWWRWLENGYIRV